MVHRVHKAHQVDSFHTVQLLTTFLIIGAIMENVNTKMESFLYCPFNIYLNALFSIYFPCSIGKFSISLYFHGH